MFTVTARSDAVLFEQVYSAVRGLDFSSFLSVEPHSASRVGVLVLPELGEVEVFLGRARAEGEVAVQLKLAGERIFSAVARRVDLGHEFPRGVVSAGVQYVVFDNRKHMRRGLATAAYVVLARAVGSRGMVLQSDWTSLTEAAWNLWLRFEESSLLRSKLSYVLCDPSSEQYGVLLKDRVFTYTKRPRASFVLDLR